MIYPEGCALDAIPEREHGSIFNSYAGWHQWLAPARSLVQERVRVLRESAAVDRYRAALTSGLGDYESREEGWPTR